MPHYLTRGMLDFGINFLTFTAIDSETLTTISQTLRNSWDCPDEDSDGEFIASQSLSLPVLSSLGHRPRPEGAPSSESEVTEEDGKVLETLLSNSVAQMIGGEVDESPQCTEREEVQAKVGKSKPTRKRRKRGVSFVGRVKKAKTPATINGKIPLKEKQAIVINHYYLTHLYQIRCNGFRIIYCCH